MRLKNRHISPIPAAQTTLSTCIPILYVALHVYVYTYLDTSLNWTAISQETRVSNIVLIVYVYFLSNTDTRVKINDTMWHHICVTWKNTKGYWQFYLDGQLQSSGTDLKKNHQIPAGGTVIIGQDQDKVGGKFDTKQSFGPGEVTEVNLWSRVLSGDEIATQKANCDITQAGLVLWWEQFKGNVTGVKIVEP